MSNTENKIEETRIAQHKEDEELKYNKHWNDSNFTLLINGERMTIKEIYEKVLNRSKEIFEKNKKIAQEQIPEGKYLLYINAVENGTNENPNINKIETERIKYWMETETGDPNTKLEDFQYANICHTFGLPFNSPKIKEYKPKNNDKLPEDFETNCIGMVFSGSDIDVFDEKNESRIERRELARKVLQIGKNMNLPIFGICFGGQLMAEEYGAKINYVLRSGEKKRVLGAIQLNKISNEIPELPKSFYVAENHGQEIEEKNLPENLKIIAKDLIDNCIDIIFIKPNKIIMQFHPEVTSTRMNIAFDMNQNETKAIESLFYDCQIPKEIIVKWFLEKVGQFAQNK